MRKKWGDICVTVYRYHGPHLRHPQSCLSRSRASPELHYPTPEETTSLSIEDQRQSSDRYGHHETNEPENA